MFVESNGNFDYNRLNVECLLNCGFTILLAKGLTAVIHEYNYNGCVEDVHIWIFIFIFRFIFFILSDMDADYSFYILLKIYLCP